jgi:hypothetical protein
MEEKVVGRWARRSASDKHNWEICFEHGTKVGHAVVRQNGNQWHILEPDGLSTNQVNMLILMATKNSPELVRHLMAQGN